MRNISIKYLCIDCIKANYSSFYDAIDEDRKNKIARLKNEDDKLRSLGAGYLIKKYIKGAILYNNQGKPYVNDNNIHFNVSHSGKYVIIALSDVPIGIDIEVINDRYLKLVDYCLDDIEKEYSKNAKSFFELWTNKESLIKCLGINVGSIKKINGLPINGIREFEEKEFSSKTIYLDNYVITTTIEGNEEIDINISDDSENH